MHLHNVLALELCVGWRHRVPNLEQRTRQQLPHPAGPRDYSSQYIWVTVQALGKELSVPSFLGHL